MIERFERAGGAIGIDLRGGQPVPGNIAGGLTTIEEKSLGAAKKGGSAPIQSVLEYAEAPRSSRACTSWTRRATTSSRWSAWSPAGCNIVAFTTGRGTPTGSPIAPCIKIATNSALYRRLTGDLDLNAGTRRSTRASRSPRSARASTRRSSPPPRGRLTAAERHGNREFSISREQPYLQSAAAGARA